MHPPTFPPSPHLTFSPPHLPTLSLPHLPLSLPFCVQIFLR